VTALASLAPYELASAVLEVLRAAERPLSAHAAAEALLAAELPRQAPERAECVHSCAQTIATALRDLVGDGRARSRWAGGIYVYEPMHSSAELEDRIGRIEAYLGGRPVKIDVSGPDPVVTITAPLSRIEAIGR
jgi:hypothetical protein